MENMYGPPAASRVPKGAAMATTPPVELRAEEEEIIRLLRELTARVGAAADEITHTLDALAELDLNLAKARYAEAMFDSF